jgi:hypothetical protein
MSRASVRVEDRDGGWAAMVREAKKLAASEVHYGIHGDAGEQTVKVAAIQEFGSREWTITSKQAYFMARRLMGIDPTAEPGRFWATFRKLRGKTMRIPERSFIRAAFDTHRWRIEEATQRAVDRVLAGQENAATELSRLGGFVEYLVRAYAIDLATPANAPLTIHVKQSENPLVDTGHMVSTIRYIIVRKR